jgi:hypothetical protein
MEVAIQIIIKIGTFLKWYQNTKSKNKRKKNIWAKDPVENKYIISIGAKIRKMIEVSKIDRFPLSHNIKNKPKAIYPNG